MARVSSRILRIAVGAAVALAPSVALACPACDAQQDKLSSTLKLVGALMLVPFLVAGVVIQVVRTTRDVP